MINEYGCSGEVACSNLDEGFVKLSYVKEVETIDSYDVDIEACFLFLQLQLY